MAGSVGVKGWGEWDTIPDLRDLGFHWKVECVWVSRQDPK